MSHLLKIKYSYLYHCSSPNAWKPMCHSYYLTHKLLFKMNWIYLALKKQNKKPI